MEKPIRPDLLKITRRIDAIEDLASEGTFRQAEAVESARDLLAEVATVQAQLWDRLKPEAPWTAYLRICHAEAWYNAAEVCCDFAARSHRSDPIETQEAMKTCLNLARESVGSLMQLENWVLWTEENLTRSESAAEQPAG